jgi:hypothetical protein
VTDRKSDVLAWIRIVLLLAILVLLAVKIHWENERLKWMRDDLAAMRAANRWDANN